MTESELDKLYRKIFERLEELEFDISDAVIHFDEIFPKASSNDIYSGTEEIPFKYREKEYKLILKKEFL
ncbi:MAG: hypothetical protein EAX89_06380 [Candidatus Lokiarchaeota archaeon]|nr:hypothetical protein [Candidatus Lokiarchaeota archaeon]